MHQALFTHRKTLQLADLLELPEVYASAHMIALWSWALDNAPDAHLPNAPRIIARAAQYPGDAQEFLNALIEVGYVERAEGGLLIHDWQDYAGRLVEKRKANAERMRNARAFNKEESATHVQRTNDARAGATVPNPTEPYQEEREREVTPTATKAISFPDNFAVTEEMQAWAKKNVPGLDVTSATEEWELSMRSNRTKYRYTDWTLAWYKAMRNAAKWEADRPGNRNGKTQTNGSKLTGEMPPDGYSWEKHPDGSWKLHIPDPQTGLYPYGLDNLDDVLERDKRERAVFLARKQGLSFAEMPDGERIPVNSKRTGTMAVA